MTLSEITGWLLIANVVFLIAWDVYVKVRQPDGNATISWLVLTAAKHAPIVAIALGIVIGHLFWQNCTKN